MVTLAESRGSWKYRKWRMSHPVIGIRSDTMSLVTVFSSQVMLRVGANSVTLLPELNKSPRAVSQPVETEKNGLVVGFSGKKTTAG
jgi:hypothetical protein